MIRRLADSAINTAQVAPRSQLQEDRVRCRRRQQLLSRPRPFAAFVHAETDVVVVRAGERATADRFRYIAVDAEVKLLVEGEYRHAGVTLLPSPAFQHDFSQYVALLQKPMRARGVLEIEAGGNRHLQI